MGGGGGAGGGCARGWRGGGGGGRGRVGGGGALEFGAGGGRRAPGCRGRVQGSRLRADERGEGEGGGEGRGGVAVRGGGGGRGREGVRGVEVLCVGAAVRVGSRVRSGASGGGTSAVGWVAALRRQHQSKSSWGGGWGVGGRGDSGGKVGRTGVPPGGIIFPSQRPGGEEGLFRRGRAQTPETEGRHVLHNEILAF